MFHLPYLLSLNRLLRLPWASLYRQFGTDPAKANDNVAQQAFRRDCLRELVKIKAPWPGLNYATGKGVLILSPSTPAIPPLPEPLHPRGIASPGFSPLHDR